MACGVITGSLAGRAICLIYSTWVQGSLTLHRIISHSLFVGINIALIQNTRNCGVHDSEGRGYATRLTCNMGMHIGTYAACLCCMHIFLSERRVTIFWQYPLGTRVRSPGPLLTACSFGAQRGTTLWTPHKQPTRTRYLTTHQCFSWYLMCLPSKCPPPQRNLRSYHLLSPLWQYTILLSAPLTTLWVTR